MTNINPSETQVTGALTTVGQTPPKCDKCDETAVYTYAWPWGETGKVCALHARLLQQTAENLGRQVMLSGINPPGPVPLTRDERAKLKGEVYALEAEAEDLKARGLALYNENLELAKQVQALTVRQRETAAQLRDARAENEELAAKVMNRDVEHGNLVDEVTRLRKLTAFLERPAPAPEGPSVVEG